MTDNQTATPDPSDVEVRLAVEKVFPCQTEKLSPQDGVRLMEDRVAELKQKIAGWNRILNADAANETAQRCVAADHADLRDAEARLQEYKLQAKSRN